MPPSAWIGAIGRCALFAGLDRAACEAVTERAGEARPGRREAFFRQGDRPASLHLLLSGRVALRQVSEAGDEVILRLIVPGEAFALVAALENGVYPATAEALRASHALVWSHEALAAIMEHHPILARNAVTVLLRRLREQEERFRELATERVAQRLARALLRLTRQAGRRVEGGVLIDLPLSREELARMTGTTLFTVSRTLSEWEQRGIVEVGRQRVLIRFPHGLVVIAEDLEDKPSRDR